MQIYTNVIGSKICRLISDIEDCGLGVHLPLWGPRRWEGRQSTAFSFPTPPWKSNSCKLEDHLANTYQLLEQKRFNVKGQPLKV